MGCLPTISESSTRRLRHQTRRRGKRRTSQQTCQVRKFAGYYLLLLQLLLQDHHPFVVVTAQDEPSLIDCRNVCDRTEAAINLRDESYRAVRDQISSIRGPLCHSLMTHPQTLLMQEGELTTTPVNCATLQLAAFQWNCCDVITSSTPNDDENETNGPPPICGLCSSSSAVDELVDASRVVPNILREKGTTTTTTCAELASSNPPQDWLRPYSSFSSSSGGGLLLSPSATSSSSKLRFGNCDDTLLGRSTQWCGCAANATIENGTDSTTGCGVLCPDTADETLALIHHPWMKDLSCLDVAYHMSMLQMTPANNDEDGYSSCSSQQQQQITHYLGFDPERLCCPSSPSSATVDNADQPAENESDTVSCALCPVPFQPAEASRLVDVVTTTTTSRTCGDANAAIALLATNDQCQAFRRELNGVCCDLDTTMSDSGSSTCLLTCPDADMTPNWFRSDPVTGHSCESLLRDYSRLSLTDCPNAMDIIGFDAVAFCCTAVSSSVRETGTTGSTTSSQPDACRICANAEEEEELIYPGRILYATPERHSCQDMANALAYSRNEDDCWRMLDESRAMTHCPCRRIITATDNGGLDDVSVGSSGANLRHMGGMHGGTRTGDLLLSAALTVGAIMEFFFLG